MVKPDVFSIVFDDLNRVYQPGKNVTGRVDLQLSKEMKMIGVFLAVFGGAETSWDGEGNGFFYNESTNTEESRRIGRNESSEVYVNTSIKLWGNGTTQILPPGRYAFPFSVCLPDCCLPSFHGGWGHIQYHCTATIDRPRPWSLDHKVKEMFTVLPVSDLNLNPSAGVGNSAEDALSLGLCCCADGTVYYQTDIPKSGFVPGECIKTTVHIDNRSSRRSMKSIELNLGQVGYFRAKSGVNGTYTSTRRHKRTISTLSENLEGMPEQSNYSLTKEVPVPPVVPTMYINSLIKVQYVLECKLIPTGLSLSQNVHLPIIIGTIPMRRLMPSAPSMQYEDNLSANPSMELSVMPSAPSEPPPPSYEDCVFGKVNVRSNNNNGSTDGNITFAPKYPVYRF